MTTLGKKTILILALFFIFWSPLIVIAQGNGITLKNESINPGSFYYSFKRLWEKGLERLQFSKQSKVHFYQSQMLTRLAELKFVVENKILSEIQTSSQRFAYTAGILTNEVIKDNVDKKNTAEQFQNMQKILSKLRDNYPANSSYWMLVQHDINSLNILKEGLK